MRSTSILLAFLSLLLFSQAAASQDKPKVQYMMWHLSPSEGATPELATRVELTLRSHFQQRLGAGLMDGLAMDSLLLVAGNEKYLRCGTGAECLAGLGREARTAFVIAGEVSLRAGRIAVILVLVDTATGKVVSRARVQGKGKLRAEQLAELSVAMFEPAKYRGAIELRCAVDGAEVRLDGKKVGLTPLVGPLAELLPGEHRIEVKKPGHHDYARTVLVVLGEKIQVEAELLAMPLVIPHRPFYKDWPFWTAGGVGVLALASAAVLHGNAIVEADNAADCRANLMACADAADDRSDSFYLQAYVVYGIGAAGLLAAGLIAALDLASAPETPTVGLVPGPDGLSMQAIWRF